MDLLARSDSVLAYGDHCWPSLLAYAQPAGLWPARLARRGGRSWHGTDNGADKVKT